MITNRKITDAEVNQNNVKSVVGSKLTGTVTQNKNVFDKLPELIVERYDDMIDDLTSVTDGTSGADNIGFTPSDGSISSTNVQNAIEETYSKTVHVNGNESISGTKTFVNSPVVPTPSYNMHAATKKYVDDQDSFLALDSAVVHNTGAETINGVKTFNNSPVVPTPTNNTDASTKKYVDDGLSVKADTTYVDTQLATKANDNAVVHLSGNETVTGVKTFNNSPIIPAPTQDTHASTKKYVDDVTNEMAYVPESTIGFMGTIPELDGHILQPSNKRVADLVDLEGDQTISGDKTFTTSPTVPTPTTNFQAANKKYVDDRTGGNTAWGLITGTLSDQTDLQSALNGKANTSGTYPSMTVGDLTEQADVVVDEVFYTKPIATGTQPYGTLNSLSGNTEVWNQLVTNGNFANGTTNWIISSGTATVSNNVLTLAGAVGRNGIRHNRDSQLYANHIYLASLNISNDVSFQISLLVNQSKYMSIPASATARIVSQIITSGANDTINFDIFPTTSGQTGNATITNVSLVDLTLRYGAGNEPTTTSDERIVQLVRDLANNPTYDAGSLVSATVDKLVSNGVSPSTFTSEYPIPSAIQSLDGYGRSAGNVRNEVNFVTKKYIKRVGAVDLGTLDWIYRSDNNVFTLLISEQRIFTNNILCGMYTTHNVGAWQVSNMEISNASTYNLNDLIVKNTSYTSADTFKAAMSGVMLYYELATPTETDISSIVPTDLFVNVEAGGTLTAHNTSGKGVKCGVKMTFVPDIHKYLNLLTAEIKKIYKLIAEIE